LMGIARPEAPPRRRSGQRRISGNHRHTRRTPFVVATRFLCGIDHGYLFYRGFDPRFFSRFFRHAAHPKPPTLAASAPTHCRSSRLL
jgi:hypothetical protein